MPHDLAITAACAVLTAMLSLRDMPARQWRRWLARAVPVIVFGALYAYFHLAGTPVVERAPLIRWLILAMILAWSLDTGLYLVLSRYPVVAWLKRWTHKP